MPSSYSASARYTLQAPGENLNAWGTILNNGAFSLIDSNVNGWLSKALTGNYTLTTANGAADEARVAMLKFTGTGPFSVTIPSVSKPYDVWNACSADLTITTGGTTNAVLKAGEKCRVICDGSNVYRVQPTDFGAQKITSVADPSNPQDAATKAYVDATAFSMAAGALPGQVGSAGKFLKTDGSAASWQQVMTTDLGDIATYTAQRNAFAIAMAIAL